MNSVYIVSDDPEIQLMLDEAYKNEAALRFNDSQIQAAELIGIILNQPPCDKLSDACKKLRDRIIDWNKYSPFAYPNEITESWKIWNFTPKGSFIFYYTMQTVMFKCEQRLIDLNPAAGQSIIYIDDFFTLLFGTVEEIPLPPSYQKYKNSVVTESNAVKMKMRVDGNWIGILKDMVGIIKSDKDLSHYVLFTLLTQHLKRYSNELRSEREVLEAKKKEYACVVCRENLHDVVFQSCRMCCVCQSCFEKIKKTAQNDRKPMQCPLCRQEIENPILLTKWNRAKHGDFKYSKSSMKDVFSLLASLQTHA